MNKITLFVVPSLVLGIMIYGFIKKVNLYDSFVNGAKEGLSTVVTIFPFIIGMIFAINIFIKSGFIDFTFSFLAETLKKLNIPLQVLPMAALRPISGTATLAILNDIYANYGPDSYAGRLASAIQGSSDTTFYVLTLYFGSIGVKKIRYSLKVGLISDLIGIVVAFLVTYLFFG